MTRLTVAMLTYRRPVDLARTLPLLESQVREVAEKLRLDADLLVVDNDPLASGQNIVNALGSPRVRYVVEATPGISAGRNRALDESMAADVIVFIDDDEKPTPQWLETLYRTWRNSQTTAVVGRVISELPENVDAWVVAGEFFVRPQRVTGARMLTAATNNLLIDAHHVRSAGLRFDTSLGLSGGEDNMFSRQLIGSGGSIIFTNDAVVIDVVPAERATRRFVLARSWSHGNTSAIVDIRLATGATHTASTRLRTLGKGGMRILGGIARHGFGLITGSDRHQARGLRTAFRGSGMVAGAIGYVYQEYARQPPETISRSELQTLDE